MYIEKTVENRGGRRLGQPQRERVPSESRDKARETIELEAAAFRRHGYNDEHDYWWACDDTDEYQVTRWHIMPGAFE